MENNYAKNLTMLKKCQKIYNIIFWIYVVSSVPLIGITIIYGTLSLASVSNNIKDYVGTLILLLAFLATGILSVYKKETKFTYLPVPVSLLLKTMSIFFSSEMYFLNVITLDSLESLHIIVAVVCSAVITVTNKKYHWLEQQDGFPYFNERFEENKNKISEQEKNSPYQYYIDRYKNSSGKMDEI
ncbi:MAG: hypothetical protein K2K02_02410 [Ruminococcus sp.]|nr:hypothetical protein [Ruminococcus sp.]